MTNLLKDVSKFFFLLMLNTAKGINIEEFSKQFQRYGYNSLILLFVVGVFIGVVQVLQLYQGFSVFSAEGFIGYTIFISMVKEFGPILGTLMLIGKNISMTTAEISSLKVSKQLEMMELLNVNMFRLIFAPRFLGMMISFPLLIIFFCFVSISTSYVVGIYHLDINASDFYYFIDRWVSNRDILEGVGKTVVFTFFISALSIYIGTGASRDSRSIGTQTTKAVVVCSIVVFLLDYILSVVFFYI